MSENISRHVRQGQQRRPITFFLAIFIFLFLVIGAGLVAAGSTEKASQQAIGQPRKSGDRSGARDVPPWLVKHDNRLSDVPPPPCTPGWGVEDYDISGYSLNHVDGAAANDVWAVGYYNGLFSDTALIEHWDGSTWSVADSPVPAGSTASYMSGVAVVSSSDVWAVGYYISSGGTDRTLIEHWNGSAWSVFSSPNQGSTDNSLSDVSAASASDVWAVGGYSTGTSSSATLIEHWNGSAWSISASPNPGTGTNFFTGVATSPSDAWAVGIYDHGQGTVDQTLIEHWNGSAWSIIASPNQGPSDNLLFGVAEVSPTDVWTVGDYGTGTGTQILVEHWNGSAWSIIASPNPSSSSNELDGIAVNSANDIWAVGIYYEGTNAVTLVERWNGSSWSVVPSANRGPDNLLVGVGVVGPNDVWAVGWDDSSTNRSARTLTEHWDGSSWSVVPSVNPLLMPEGSVLTAVTVIRSDYIVAVGYYVEGGVKRTLLEQWSYNSWQMTSLPNQGNGDNVLTGVAEGASDTDIWTVGYYDSGSVAKTLVLHYDTTGWHIVSSPNQGTGNNALLGVARNAAGRPWAVGYYNDGTSNRTLIMHWNGTTWNIFTSPNQGAGDNYLYSVVVASTNNTWATGYYNNANGVSRTLVEHYDGTSWSIVPSANQSSDSALYAITAPGANDLWAVGSYSNGSNFQTLIEHYNGSAWSIVGSPNRPGGDILYGVAAASSADIWAVGHSYNVSGTQTLVEHYDGSAWSIVNTPDAGSEDNSLAGVVTSGGDVWAVGYYDSAGGASQPLILHDSSCPPTPTATPVVTPTACPLQFTDVPAGSTFYDFVRCLACRSIINGYSDNTFRPNNNVTRGQLSKIVSNAAGFIDPQSTQIFQDVPVGSTFFDFIGRLATRGYIGGYACGGAGEPCVAPDNLPYFRPNNNATRGQITKIVANAAQLNQSPTGQQFEDVPIGSTYYTYTYRLVTLSIMSGYPCGNPEPCVPPTNLPYFRPNNNATRGQTSKIVSNTFYLNCQTPIRRKDK